LILKGLNKMLSFKKINNFNRLHKFQEKTWNSSETIKNTFLYLIHVRQFLMQVFF